MAILAKLAELGFANSEELGASRGVTTVRVRTSSGWVYEKFASDEQVSSWAKFHKPESDE